MNGTARNLYFLLVCSSLFFLASCTSENSFKERVGRAFKEDPSLLSLVAQKAPEKFVMSLQEPLATVHALRAQETLEKREAEIAHYLRRPLQARQLSSDIFRGNPDAALTIVQYIDFQCSFCAHGQVVMERLRRRYGNHVRFLIRHMPAVDHPYAMPAALTFEALKRQGADKAFDWHDQVFEQQEGLKRGHQFLISQARLVGANVSRLKEDINDPELHERIRADIAEAERFGFQGAPGYLVGGVPVRGAYPEEVFIRLIEEVSRQARLGAR